MAKPSWKRLTNFMPGISTKWPYCRLPWHQRWSRRMNSISVGGFSSQPRSSSGSTRTSKPARRISAASIWSWLSTWPASTPSPGSGGMWQYSMNGASRIAALWPQYGPQSACHQALPMVQERMPSRMPNWKMRANALVEGRPTTRPCRMPSRGSACMMRTSRRIAAEVMKLSVSSVTANSCWSPQRWQKSQKLPALKPVLTLRRR